MKQGNKNAMSIRQAISLIRDMREAEGIIVKDHFHMEAMQMGMQALEEQGGNAMYIRMLRYHVKTEGAMVFPDGLTKAMLEAAEKALSNKRTEGGGGDAQAD